MTQSSVLPTATTTTTTTTSKTHSANELQLIQEIKSLELGESEQLAMEIIQSNSSPNTIVQQKDKNTLLHLAVLQGKSHLVKKLLNLGADIMSTNNEGKSVLSLALKINDHIKNDTWVCTIMDILDYSLTQELASLYLVDTSKQFGTKTIQEDHRFKIKITRGGMPKVLCIAVLYGKLHLVKNLLELGADAKCTANERNRSALSFASELEKQTPNNQAIYVEILRHLPIQEIKSLELSESKQQLAMEIMQGNICPNTIIKEEENNTLLHLAIINGKLHLVKRLLELKADVTSTNIEGKSALSLASELEKQTPNNQAIYVEIQNHLLIQEIKSLNLGESKQQLAMEIMQGNSSPNTIIKEEENNALLHLAIINGKLHLVKRLLELGADVTSTNKEGKSALLLALALNDQISNSKEICIAMLDHLKTITLLTRDNINARALTFFKDVKQRLDTCIESNLHLGINGNRWADRWLKNLIAKRVSLRSGKIKAGSTNPDWEYFKGVCQVYAKYYQTLLVSYNNCNPKYFIDSAFYAYSAQGYSIWGMNFADEINDLTIAFKQELESLPSQETPSPEPNIPNSLWAELPGTVKEVIITKDVDIKKMEITKNIQAQLARLKELLLPTDKKQRYEEVGMGKTINILEVDIQREIEEAEQRLEGLKNRSNTEAINILKAECNHRETRIKNLDSRLKKAQDDIRDREMATQMAAQEEIRKREMATQMAAQEEIRKREILEIQLETQQKELKDMLPTENSKQGYVTVGMGEIINGLEVEIQKEIENVKQQIASLNSEFNKEGINVLGLEAKCKADIKNRETRINDLESRLNDAQMDMEEAEIKKAISNRKKVRSSNANIPDANTGSNSAATNPNTLAPQTPPCAGMYVAPYSVVSASNDAAAPITANTSKPTAEPIPQAKGEDDRLGFGGV